MFFCCGCCVLSGRGLCDALITRPEESYRLWCVVECNLKQPRERGGHGSRGGGAVAQKRKHKPLLLKILCWLHVTVTIKLFEAVYSYI